MRVTPCLRAAAEPLRFLGSVGMVAPTFNVDFVDGGDTELVYGLSFGRAF